MRIVIALVFLLSNFSYADGIIVLHSNLSSTTNNNNTIMGIATPSLGAKDSEIWRSQIEINSKTPLHQHEAEEIVVLLSGTLEAEVNGKSVSCTAPCTIILPANEPHMLKNIGDIPTDQILIMKSQSKISDQSGQEMQLPWRK